MQQYVVFRGIRQLSLAIFCGWQIVKKVELGKCILAQQRAVLCPVFMHVLFRTVQNMYLIGKKTVIKQGFNVRDIALHERQFFLEALTNNEQVISTMLQ